MPHATILLVDDDSGMLQLLAMRLEASHYNVICAASGPEALKQMQKHVPDVVITDLRMEEMSGLALFESIHAEWPSLPVIILTAHGSIKEAVEATQKGVYSFLTKPVDRDELLTTLSQVTSNITPNSHDGSNDWQKRFNTRSAKMYHLLEQAKLLCNSDVNVLLSGGSGTGKELLARNLHQMGDRKDKPFVAINCSAIPTEILESELFGHVKGAFTGASNHHEGLFVAAEGGVVFLDEIGDMSLPLQAKLLRVLQEKHIRPVGGVKDIPINVRVISATHKNLEQAIEADLFREDLYYRLNVVTLTLPNLRERKEDIPLLVNRFLDEIAIRNNKPIKKLAPQAMTLLLSYDWPGNVRQLRNVIEQAVALSASNVISQALIENALPQQSDNDHQTLTDAKREFEREYVIDLLRSTQGSISSAAKLAGRNRSDFYKIVQRHNIDASQYK